MELVLTTAVPIELQPGRYCITPERDAEARIAAEASAGDGLQAHPIFAFIMALNGLGESVADIYSRIGASLDDGPVLASCRIDYPQSFRVGESYDVTGRIIGLISKSSRRFGQTRHMTQRVDIQDSAGQPVASIELKVVIPTRTTHE